jgi:hypothetical protein
MMKKLKHNDLTQYRTFGLTLLQFMGVLVVTGIVVNVVLKVLFS